MIVFRKARSGRQTLNDLEAYLNSIGDEPVEWLAREVRRWGEFSYSELEAAITEGRLNELIDWQARYAEVVNSTFAPMWIAAMAAAAAKATKGKIILDDSDVYVKAWIREHGGELITRLTESSRQAIRAIILHGQAERMLPRDMAKQVRPLIGLTEPQVQANANYREKIYQRYLESGASQATAAARADKAALKYASKQHRYRAETIVNTELAFAYNQGKHMGTIQAINNGLMGRCEMVWSTAGTNRVCSRCLALKDKVVGHTDESGVTLPPLHPRCRCAIMYREVGDKPLTVPKPNVTPKEIHGGVECKIENTQEALIHGKIQFVAKCYSIPDGTKFIFPAHFDSANQTMTPDDAIEIWLQLSEKFRSKAQKKICFIDIENPDDAYWRIRYKNFPRSYATGGDEIIFYRYEYKHDAEYVKYTYRHEAGHFIDKTVGGGVYYSESVAWRRAMSEDEKNTGSKSVSTYGENSPQEDFADSIAFYDKNPKDFITKFPNRGKLLEKILK